MENNLKTMIITGVNKDQDIKQQKKSKKIKAFQNKFIIQKLEQSNKKKM